MNSLTFPILRHLADGKFHSGEVLAQQFKVTRVTVWNAIQHAQQLGVAIFSVRGRGYKLSKALTFLDEAEIRYAIGMQRAWFKLIILDEVDSTNTYLLRQATKGAAHITCVAAHVQTQGRGRRGRTWISNLGASLTFSLLWRFQCGAAALSGLSLAVGVALIRALRDFNIEQAQLKWPNDILINQQKLAGILIDLQGDMDGPSAAVIGVGVNIDLPEAVKGRIDQPVTDLASVSRQPIQQSHLLGVLLKHLAVVLGEFEQVGFSGLRHEWLSYHAYQFKPVRMAMPDGRTLDGVVQDVTEDGILLVETAIGLQRFSAGEISLRSA